MNARLLQITSELRLFLREFLRALESGGPETRLQGGGASGGRLPGTERFSFTYSPPDKGLRWVFDVDEPQLRELASGRLLEVPARRRTMVVPRRRPASGQPLLVWGAGELDLLEISTENDLGVMLQALRLESLDKGPRAFHLWSRCEDLLEGVIHNDLIAVRVVWSDGKGCTSQGDEVQLETLVARGVELAEIEVFWCDFLAIDTLIERLTDFAQQGELPQDLPRSERIEPRLLDLSRRHREGVLSKRSALTEPAETSLAPWIGRELPGAPVFDAGELARRLLDRLLSGELLSLEDGVSPHALEEPVTQLIEESGALASSSEEAANEMADALSELEGVDDIFISGEELMALLVELR